MASFPNLLTPIYVTPTEIRRMLGTTSQATNDDDLLLWFGEQASRRIEEHCNRKFYIYRQSMALDWPGNSWTIETPEDLHTVLTITNGDGSVITATSVIGGSTVNNYYVYPNQEYPRYKIQLAVNSGKVWLFTGTPQQAITLDCLWGFPAVPNSGQYTVNSGVTVQDATGQTAIQTTLLAATGTFQAGQTLLIESEAQIIQSIATGVTNDTITVLRGAAGTTATTHAKSTAIYAYVFNQDIVHAAARLIGYFYRQKDSGVYDSIGIQQMGTLTIPMAIPQDVKAILGQYVRMSH